MSTDQVTESQTNGWPCLLRTTF